VRQMLTESLLVASIGAGMTNFPHGLFVDKDGNVWITDGREDRNKKTGHTVMKLSPDGKVLMTLGTPGQAGNDATHFNAPSDVVVAPNGDIFVADGHGEGTNERIMKFDKTGKFIKAWGKKGQGPGDFDCPHTLAFDSRGRLYVGDRQNNRIQIFSQDGAFIAEWKQFGRPSGIFIDGNDVMYVADSESRDGAAGYGYDPGTRRGIRIGDARNGNVYAFIPDTTAYPYPVSDSNNSTSAEGITADALGNIYGAEFTMDVKKYVRK